MDEHVALSWQHTEASLAVHAAVSVACPQYWSALALSYTLSEPQTPAALPAIDEHFTLSAHARTIGREQGGKRRSLQSSHNDAPRVRV